MQIRKSVAGKAVSSMAYLPHRVTRVGEDKARNHQPMLEMVTKHGKRYMLSTKNGNIQLAKLYRQLFDSGNEFLMPLQLRGKQLGAVGSEGEFKPIFTVGRLFGVTKQYIDAVRENWQSKRKKKTLNESIDRVCADLKMSRTQLFSSKPEDSPFPEYKQSGYGARWPQCARVLRRVRNEQLKALSK